MMLLDMKLTERKGWLQNMKTINWTPKTYDTLCSLHFDDECFDKHFNRTTLKPGSIPTIFEGLLTLSVRAHAQSIAYNSDLTLLLEPSISGGFTVGLKKGDDDTIVYGVIGRAFSSAFVSEEVEGGVLITLGPVNLTVHTLYDQAADGHGIHIKWQTDATLYRLDDCYDFLSDQWYGGPMQEEQLYPIQSATLNLAPYVTQERDNRNVAERYWLSSAGQYIHVQPEAPLFVDYSNLLSNHICFIAQVAEPYDRDTLVLEYEVWWLPNVKVAHQHAVNRFLGKPSAVPDKTMVQQPIWSTWAKYWYDVNEENVLQFAEEISAHNFTNSQLEIDDNWEICYGSLTVNETKFPNFTQMVQTLKDQGYRVTLWIHPFINSGCEPWYSEAIENNFVVVNQQGSANTTWWNSAPSGAVHVDFTNSAAAEWWSNRVRNLQQVYGIDSFKFDAGETSQLPQISFQHGDKNLHPLLITEAYVRTCAEFGNMVEVRSAANTQDLPIYIRMVDRDSIWGLNNGLPTVLTSTFQMNLAGYPFVLPDMIGGNGFNLNHEQASLPSKELFIRWVQATTFLPVMQFSFAPWNFDDETVEISRKYSELHTQYSDVIWSAMEQAVVSGAPVNAPLWWVAPLDNQTFTIWDEYLVGEGIIVAPVLEPGVTSRDIYLPAGSWLEAGNISRIHEGPLWLRNFSAPIDTLPFFVREANDNDAASVPRVALFVILCTSLVNIFM